jgi:hypothetical protein
VLSSTEILRLELLICRISLKSKILTSASSRICKARDNSSDLFKTCTIPHGKPPPSAGKYVHIFLLKLGFENRNQSIMGSEIKAIISHQNRAIRNSARMQVRGLKLHESPHVAKVCFFRMHQTPHEGQVKTIKRPT